LIEYVNRAELAALLGISRQRVRALESKGALPEPDAMLGDRPLWLRATAERIVAERVERG